MNQGELPRNPHGLRSQMIFVIGSFLFASIVLWFLTWKFSKLTLDGLTPFNFFVDSIIMFIFLGIILILLIIFMQRSWAKEKYYIRGGLLIVSTKNPLTGSTNEDVYRLDTVITASVTQTAFGKKDNFGDILITIPKLNGNDVLTLKDIVSPRDEILKLHSSLDSGDKSGLAITN